jgi:hypothetical protein
MPLNILDEAHIHPAIRKKVENNRADFVREVQAAIASNKVVVVGIGPESASKEGAQSARRRGRALQVSGIRQLLQRLAKTHCPQDEDWMADLPDGVRQGGACRRRQRSSKTDR